jgi:hypothetical protein
MNEHAPAPREPGLAFADVLVTLLIGALILSWLPLVLPHHWAGYYGPRLWLPLWLISGVIYGGAQLETRSRWVKLGVRVTRSQFVDYGGGFYGAVGLSAFMLLEWRRFVEEWGDFVLDPSWRGLWENLWDFGLDSIMNGIYAFVWPAFHGKAFHAGDFWVAVVVGWGVYTGTKKLMQRLPRRAEPAQRLA